MVDFKHIDWVGDAANGYLRLLDQTRLPERSVFLECATVADVHDAIRRLSVRGAPAIGIAAAFGCVVALASGKASSEFSGTALERVAAAADLLAGSRPTAVNLFYALDRMRAVAREHGRDEGLAERLLAEARAIHDEDRRACDRIGRYALDLLREVTDDDLRLLTHCNAGSLATGGIGTATAPMYAAKAAGHPLVVFADETRPLLQGSRLTAWELRQAGIDVTLLTDSMAAQAMRSGLVKAVITGADRIAANGDVANKIGTYGLAVLAWHHNIPFVVAVPTTTIDGSTPSGEQIPIESRSPEEVTEGFGRRTAPQGISVYSPAFDVTPADLITAIVTDRGVIRPVTELNVRAQLAPRESSLHADDLD